MARQRIRRKIELGWFEAAVLLLGYVASLAVVGVAGIFIGQRAVPERLVREERLIRLPVSRSGGSSGQDFGSADPEMTFRKVLGRNDEPAREGRIIMPEKAPERAPAKATPRATTQTRAETPAKPPAKTAAKTAAKPPEKAAAKVSEEPQGPGEGFSRTPTGTGVAGHGEPPGIGGRPAEAKPAAARVEEPYVAREPERSRASQRVTAEAAATAQALRDGDSAAPEPWRGPRGQPGDAGAATLRTAGSSPEVTPEVAATARAVTTPDAIPAPAGPSDGTWSVQVNATMDQTLANSLAQRLRERGYDAFVVEQLRDGVTWYRVRVGRLQSIEMANELVSKMKETEGLAQAFVASD